MNNFVGAGQGDKEPMLGKFLYFSPANLLVEKEITGYQELQVRAKNIGRQKAA